MLIDLAQHSDDGPVHIVDIAQRQNLSVKYLEQIVRPLKKAGLISSVRGPKGGHLLAKSPEEVTLGRIVRLLEAGSDLVGCVGAPDRCEMSDECRVRAAWAEANTALFDKLDAITIADMLDNSFCSGAID